MMPLLTMLFVILCWLVPLRTYSQALDNKIIIGVFSPETDEASVAGASHRYWTNQGLIAAGNISNRHTNVKLEPIFIDTQSNDPDCHRKMKEFLEQYKKAALIIGPVRSGCAKNLIENDVSIPIVSSLASASILTDDANLRSKWFFRANISDKNRLNSLVKFIGRSPRFNKNSSYIIYEDETPYGRGLAKDLLNILKYKKTPSQTIREGLNDISSLKAKLGQYENETNLFVLGGAAKVVNFAKLLLDQGDKNLNNKFHIFTVGMNRLFQENFIDGLITIGEVGFNENKSVQFMPEWQRINNQAEKSGNKFYPTIYSAARFIVPKAIKGAMSKLESDYSTTELREAIRQELEETDNFDSLSPPDVLSFDGKGDLIAKFRFPIYKLEPSFKEIDVDRSDSQPWIEIIPPSGKVSFLESPVSISLIGHNTEGISIDVSLVDSASGAIYKQIIDKLHDNQQTTVTFHTKWLGEYHLTSNRDMFPALTPVKVEFSLFYLICAFFAVIGVFSKNKTSSNRLGFAPSDVTQGVIFGLALAFISTYVKYSIVPVVETDWNLLNGAMYGFIGGFFGPWILRVLVERFGLKLSTH